MVSEGASKLKYEYQRFCHGMEYNLDRYLGTNPIIDQGVKKKVHKKKVKIIETSMVDQEDK